MHIKLDLKIFLFMLIFLLTKRTEIYAMLMSFALLHELGHLVCGLILGFKPEQITIMPYGLNLKFKIDCNDYNKKVKKGTVLSVKKIIIALAGPLTNIIIAIILLILPIITNITHNILTIDKIQELIYCNLLIGIFNLIPIYPMDGGKIIHETLHIFYGLRKSYKITQNITWIVLSILTAISSILILYYKNIAILITISYLWLLALKTHNQMNIKVKIYEKLKYIL